MFNDVHRKHLHSTSTRAAFVRYVRWNLNRVAWLHVPLRFTIEFEYLFTFEEISGFDTRMSMAAKRMCWAQVPQVPSLSGSQAENPLSRAAS